MEIHFMWCEEMSIYIETKKKKKKKSTVEVWQVEIWKDGTYRCINLSQNRSIIECKESTTEKDTFLQQKCYKILIFFSITVLPHLISTWIKCTLDKLKWNILTENLSFFL